MEKKGKIDEKVGLIEYDNPNLTRISPDTAFVINHKSGRVRYIFRKKSESKMISQLIENKIINEVSQLRRNRYGDLLIM